MDEHDYNSLKARVAELEDRLNYIYTHFGLSYNQNPANKDPRIIDLIRSGNKIGAIKLYREMTNAGLAEAKGVIDHIEAGL
ncbi:MAG: hypothetical protein JETCAE01_26120 [Anaerolineaceae bacterium]|nr:MAG: hypothetical protein JETCAE01_26120 [Anaerolineaceae bacterium]